MKFFSVTFPRNVINCPINFFILSHELCNKLLCTGFISGEITKMTEVTVSSKVSDVTFFPSKDGHDYNIVMTSQELPEIYSVQLNNGKITSLKGNLENNPYH